MVEVHGAAAGRDVLTRSEAAGRAHQVSALSYRLELDLPGASESYAGRARIEMDVTDRSRPLFLDFTGRVVGLRIDGDEVTPDHRDHRLWLPMDRLSDRPVVEVEYHNSFDLTGAGFHRFVDPEDAAEYVYSDFEPFAAHRLFPCFDQPDLKATFELVVDAPSDWEVVTSGIEEVVDVLPDGRSRHRFGRTPRFSSYLLAVVAGPYARVAAAHDGIPLGLYGRRSMAAILEREAPELLEVTGQGFDLFRELFGQPYAFGKYDQLFVPEFNAGAMENVAAVTFHDSFLFRDPPTDAQRLERAEVVLHELAHMWFGDLVTLRWWDDLWLNESFATWASFHALTKATRFRDAWTRFNGAFKPAAYRDDQRVTTHPVASPVPDTDAAQAGFDAIVYEKGASVLRQLVATVGEETFAAGMRGYFERHAWGNATVDDLLAAVGAAAGRSLDTWADGWLRAAGADVVSAGWTETVGRVEDMAVGIVAPDPTAPVRSHAMHVGLVHQDGSALRVSSFPILAQGPRTSIPAADGMPAPLLVFPNHGDHDYVRVALDGRSTAFALARLDELDDPLLRQQLWSTLWDMVRECLLPSTVFLDAVALLLPREQDQDLADAVLEHAVATLAGYLPESHRAPAAGSFVDRALVVVTEPRAPGLRRTWLRAAAAAAPDAIGTPAVDRLLDLADEARGASDLVDQDLRWTLATIVSVAGRPDASGRIEAEAARDRSDRGVRARLTAEVAYPDPDRKAAAWERLSGDGYGSFHLTRAAMRGFQWTSQRELLEPYRDPFFTGLRAVFKDREYAFARSWLRLMLPGLWAEPDVVERARGLLASLGPGDATLARHLAEAVDDLERAIRVRAYALDVVARPG